MGQRCRQRTHPMYNDLLRFVVMQDRDWDFRTLDVSRQLELARKADNGALLATSLELSPFVSRGGKLLIYHGWADQNIPPRESVNYYDGLVKTMGKEKSTALSSCTWCPGWDTAAAVTVPTSLICWPSSNTGVRTARPRLTLSPRSCVPATCPERVRFVRFRKSRDTEGPAASIAQKTSRAGCDRPSVGPLIRWVPSLRLATTKITKVTEERGLDHGG